MDELLNAIGEAWEKVKVRILEDAGELRKRVGRMKGLLERPPRAWCLAVRASDTRITTMHAIITPGWAVHPVRRWGREGENEGGVADHTVLLDSRLMRRLCRPVRIPFPGLPWDEVAQMLGVHCETLRVGMRTGVFEVRHIQGLGGTRGGAIPVLYSERMFDPSTGACQEPIDRLWGTFWKYLCDHVPDGIEQEVKRTAVYRKYRNSRRFRGYRWICPGCGLAKRTLFYPLPPLLGVNGLKSGLVGRSVEEMRRRLGLDEARAVPCFACKKCHKVRYFSRVDKACWNEFVAHLTEGLLYGSEVKRPADLAGKRKRAFKKRNAKAKIAAGEKGEVLRLLAAGKTKQEVADAMGLSFNRVNYLAVRLYVELGVKTRGELAERVRRGKCAA